MRYHDIDGFNLCIIAGKLINDEEEKKQKNRKNLMVKK